MYIVKKLYMREKCKVDNYRHVIFNESKLIACSVRHFLLIE